jgi:DNA-binding response OmpR family regulator
VASGDRPKRRRSRAPVAILASAMSDAPAPRLLLVDDDPVIVRLLQVNFRLEGFTIETASRGDEALELALASPPDIVVLDMMLPGLTGDEVCRRMRESPDLADVPIVFLTARADEGQGHDYALGVVDYIAKPFDPVTVVETVRRRLAERLR